MAFRLRLLTVMSALVLAASGAAAQSSAQEKDKKETASVAEAARRAREQRAKNNVAQAVREFTNDTLPAARIVENVSSGSASAMLAAGGGTTGGTGATAQPSEEDEKGRSEAGAAVAAEKEKLEKSKKELELLERETKLNKASFYARPDYANDRDGAAALAAQDTAIAAKKTEIAASEAKIAELEEKAKAINDRLGPKPEEPKTPEQQRDAWAGKLQPLQDEVAKIDAQLASINQERAALGNSGSNPPGAFTADRIAQLQRRRAELQTQISAIQDDARRAGTLPIRN